METKQSESADKINTSTRGHLVGHFEESIKYSHVLQ